MNKQTCYTERQVMLNKLLRKLWEQHVMWTRSFIISTVEELDDLELVTNRLLSNPTDFAKALSLFYDSETAHHFQELFTDHLEIAAKLVNATKDGNEDEALNYRRLWYQNADEIADFLNTINPYWSFIEWQRLLYSHLLMIEMEAFYRINKQYNDDIKIYDTSEEEALMMADFMADGLIKQFDVQ